MYKTGHHMNYKGQGRRKSLTLMNFNFRDRRSDGRIHSNDKRAYYIPSSSLNLFNEIIFRSVGGCKVGDHKEWLSLRENYSPPRNYN